MRLRAGDAGELERAVLTRHLAERDAGQWVDPNAVADVHDCAQRVMAGWVATGDTPVQCDYHL